MCFPIVLIVHTTPYILNSKIYLYFRLLCIHKYAKNIALLRNLVVPLVLYLRR